MSILEECVLLQEKVRVHDRRSLEKCGTSYNSPFEDYTTELVESQLVGLTVFFNCPLLFFMTSQARSVTDLWTSNLIFEACSMLRFV